MSGNGTPADWQALGLGSDELRVYEALWDTPAPSSADAVAQALGLPAGRVADALGRLGAHGFTLPAARDSELPRAVPPATALRNLVHQRQSELLRKSADVEALAGSVDRLAAQLLSTVRYAPALGIEAVHGRQAIAERVNSLLASASHDLALLDRPPYAASSPEGTPAPLAVTDAVRRGVRVRTVVDRDGLDFPGRARGLNELSAQGVHIRVGVALPTKLITADRRVTLLPPTDAADPTASALVVSDSLLSNAIVPLFDAVWERATPIGSASYGEISEQDQELLTLLTSGLKDEAIARRMGLHVHTVRRRISHLLRVLNAETRFQAGVQAILRGWLPV
ncbi:helix-turn-helix transcriptional regulator [Streptomyces sp. CA-111067]|uniref:helix-turn-helix transcriptional regulator n=1 Tax=Streptomyces sp. CA-111067 TaxID=3240046 RepID=UPI003D95F42E